MIKRVFRNAMAGVFLLLLALSTPLSFAQDSAQSKTVDGMSVYIGVLPAEMLLGHPVGHHEREMHGGPPAGAGRYHVVVALFDAASGKRMTDAEVRIGGASIGMAPFRKKAEIMMINNTTTYGNYVSMPGPGPYKIYVEIRRRGSKPVELEFDYPFARS